MFTPRSGRHIVRMFLVAAVVSLCAAAPAQAVFHLMQIEQVIGGVNGDKTAQAIQLRMRSNGQDFVSVSRVRAWNAAGGNPVLIVDMTSNVLNGSTGDRVLITTTAFDALTSPNADSDFTMTSRIPDAYLEAGSLTFEEDDGTIYWRLSWGGASYTGPSDGEGDNDDNNPGNFGPPFAGPLPSADLQSLRFTGSATALSTSNAADYALSGDPAVFVNNARQSFELDCNGNDMPDADDIAAMTSEDCNNNGVPDECEPDANDCDNNDVPDDCPSEPDADNDRVIDPCDGCPNDPNKTAPGQCGCGNPDTDSDNDGTANCNDGCPNDPNKTAPGVCGCGVSDRDSDGDGVRDCNDDCPDDPNKTEPGVCGCGFPDDDQFSDDDGDGTPNCFDGCPNDPNKTEPGLCGCGEADDATDSDGDGVADCIDNCPGTPNPNQADADGDDIGDACDNDGGGNGNGDGDGGTMCGSGMCGLGVPAALPIMLLGIGYRRLRRRS